MNQPSHVSNTSNAHPSVPNGSEKKDTAAALANLKKANPKDAASMTHAAELLSTAYTEATALASTLSKMKQPLSAADQKEYNEVKADLAHIKKAVNDFNSAQVKGNTNTRLEIIKNLGVVTTTKTELAADLKKSGSHVPGNAQQSEVEGLITTDKDGTIDMSFPKGFLKTVPASTLNKALQATLVDQNAAILENKSRESHKPVTQAQINAAAQATGVTTKVMSEAIQRAHALKHDALKAQFEANQSDNFIDHLRTAQKEEDASGASKPKKQPAKPKPKGNQPAAHAAKAGASGGTTATTATGHSSGGAAAAKPAGGDKATTKASGTKGGGAATGTTKAAATGTTKAAGSSAGAGGASSSASGASSDGATLNIDTAGSSTALGTVAGGAAAFSGFPNINGLLMAVLLECYKSGQKDLQNMTLRLQQTNQKQDAARTALSNSQKGDEAKAKAAPNNPALQGPSANTQTLQNQLSGMGDDAQMQQLQLQTVAQNQSVLLQMISDFSKSNNSNSLSIVRNIVSS